MLLHVSNGSYVEGVCLSERFLVHVEALFLGVDELDKIHHEYRQTGRMVWIGNGIICLCVDGRIQVYTRGQDALQKDHQLFHVTLQDTRDEEVGHHTRVVIVGHWIGTLSQNIDPIGTYNSLETGNYDVYLDSIIVY